MPPVTPIRAGLITAALLLPSLWLGAVLDDHQILILLSGAIDVDLAWGNLFAFIPADGPGKESLLAGGGLPWWTAEGLKMQFFRPFASWHLALDQALFGRELMAWHAHQILWAGAFVAAGAAVLRRSLPASLAGLAMLCWALDTSHGMPGAWLANRNALNAMLPATLGLWAHLRWREDGWGPGLPLSLLGYFVGLLGGETALGILAYVAAYELVGAKQRSLPKLLPAAATAVGYLALYKAMDLGTAASGIYVDPIASPGRWLAELPRKLLIFAGADFGGFPAVLPALDPETLPLSLAWGLGAGGLVLWLSRWTWGHLDSETRRSCRWLLLGAFGALLPATATFPSDRLLQATSLGTAAWLAVILVTARDTLSVPQRIRWGALPIAGLTLIVMPLGLVVTQVTLMAMGRWADETALAAELDEATLADRHHVVLAASTYEVGFYLPFIRWKHQGVLAESWRVLSIAPHDHVFTRTGPANLRLDVVDVELGQGLFEAMFRGPDHPLVVGEVLVRGPLSAEVLAVGERGPTSVAFTFESDPDSDAWRWLVWTPDGLVRVDLPPVGESLTVPFSHPAEAPRPQ